MNEDALKQLANYFCEIFAHRVAAIMLQEIKQENAQPKEEFLTTVDVAKLLNVNQNTARQKMKLMSYIKQGKSILVRKSEFDKYMREQEHKRHSNSDADDYCFTKPMPQVKNRK